MINTHGMIINFGRHAGTLWTRVPVAYLKWIINTPEMGEEKKEIARAEMGRRGTVTPSMEVSGHAIDRASQLCLSKWKQDTNDGRDEGLHAWLVRKATEARDGAHVDNQGRFIHDGLKFVFELDGEWPVLLTINWAKRIRRKNHVS